MPRGPRLDAPGVTHHVTLRGVGRRDLFRDGVDREAFLARLGPLLLELDFVCLAWALMPNHVHLIVRTGRVPISRLMARLCTGYALHFARRHAWVGHVFQNRFASSRVGDDAYLRAAIAYVHRNPAEAQLVTPPSLGAYPWCSHGAAIGARAPRAFETVHATRAAFDGDVGALEALVARGGPMPSPVQWRRLPRRSPASRAVRCGASWTELAGEVSAETTVSLRRLWSRERTRAVARARVVLAERAVRGLGMTLSEVARRLQVSPSAVTRMLQRARRHGENPKTQRTSP